MKADKLAKYAPVEKEEEKEEAKVEADPITGPTVNAQMGGKVIEVRVKAGDTVAKNQVLMVYEAMKMENDILSPREGVVKRVLVDVNDVVGTDAPLIEFVE